MRGLNNMSNREPIDAISRLIKKYTNYIKVAIPARVERYDAALQQIDAQPLIKEAHFIEDGSRVAAQLPVLCNLPVCFPGAGSFRVTFPINVGDTVLVVFSRSSLDVWLSEDGLVDPLTDDANLADAFAIPGLRSFKNPLSDVAGDAMVLGSEGARIVIDDTSVRLNTTEGKLVALAEKVDQAIATLRTFATTHIHPTPSGPSSPASTPLGSNTLTACSDVYAKE